MRMIRCLAAAALMAALLISAAGAVRAAEAFHGAYLTGFPDGSIRPGAALTRAQLAVIFQRLADKPDAEAPSSCPDVPAEHWAAEAVGLVCSAELMNPEPDGLFHPDRGVTGPELAAALARLSRHEEAAARWPALKAGWEAQERSFSTGYGWVMGFDGEQFDPDAPLTRGQTAEIFNALLGRTPASLDNLLIGMPIFSDNRDANARYFLPLQEAAVDHTASQTGAHECWTALG